MMFNPKHMEQLLFQLNEFLQGPLHNAWLSDDDHIVEVYARKDAYHMIDGCGVRTFDIANISIHTPGHGIGAAILEAFHNAHSFPVTYIENVLNPRFYEFLIRNGWQDARGLADSSVPHSVFKKKTSD